QSVTVASDDAEFTVPSIGTRVYNVKINYAGNAGKDGFDVSVGVKDDDFSKETTDVGTWKVNPGVSGSNTLSVVSSGKCSSLTFTFTNVSGESLAIKSIEINRPYFHFRLGRMLLLFFILALICLIRYFKPWRIRYDEDSVWQVNLFFAVAICGILTAGLIVFASGASMQFSSDVIDQGDNYQLLTQAFSHGQLSLLTKPSSQLLALANPYDLSQRSAANVSFLWDSALYHGKYYAYYGIAPVLILLLPFRLITGFYLPTALAVLIFICIALLAMMGLYRNIIRCFFPETDFLTFISGAVVSVFGFSLLWVCGRPYFYELAVSSGLAFLLLALNMLLLLYRSPRHTTAKLFLCGLFFALMTASRINLVLYIAVAIPFLPTLLGRGGAKRKAGRATVFLAPLVFFAALLMGYNWLRFGSPLQTGAKYQLTISDIAYNKITDVSKLVNGFFHYVLQPLSVDLNFPFFHVTSETPANMTQYYYNQPIAGIFSFPIYLIVLAGAFIVRRMPRRSLKKRFAALMLIVPLVFVPVDILLGGVIMRYMLDILPVLGIAALMLWLEASDYFTRRQAGAPVAKLFACTAALTSVISLSICMLGEYSYFSNFNPVMFQRLCMLFEFWR
ncbi:MAG: hypothetical protein P4M02_00310, partial [Clostridia bacterium]|nr:hypothetical protein [Clostridia bacterium]